MCPYPCREHVETFRVTTHLPVSVHERKPWRIYHKHGVPAVVGSPTIAAAEDRYLRQCPYRTPVDKKARECLGKDNGKVRPHAL